MGAAVIARPGASWPDQARQVEAGRVAAVVVCRGMSSGRLGTVGRGEVCQGKASRGLAVLARRGTTRRDFGMARRSRLGLSRFVLARRSLAVMASQVSIRRVLSRRGGSSLGVAVKAGPHPAWAGASCRGETWSGGAGSGWAVKVCPFWAPQGLALLVTASLGGRG